MIASKENMRFIKRSFYFFIEITIFISFLMILLGHSFLLTDNSKFYSQGSPHRLQTNAFLKGHLSLSPLPFGYMEDYYWSGHGLQQPWGLGAPLLRLPFEWIAVQFGIDPFPDRLVLFFYLILTIVVLNISIRSIMTISGPSPGSVAELLIRCYLIAWVLFSPALGALIRQPINSSYNENIFYGILYTYFLLSLFWMYITKLDDRIFIALCLASGLAWLIRPTLIGYGLATVTIALICAYQNKCKMSLIMAGIGCFCLGVGINLWCNYLRFGSMFDFGESENFCRSLIINYSERFDYPFRHEPFLSAAKELTGALFFNNPWESPTVRFRWGLEGYFCPFNIINLIIIAGGMISCVLFSLSRFLRPRVIYYSLVWGLICFGVLFSFYLRTPFMHTRYLSEFSPAFNAIFIALILLSLSRLNSYFRDKRILILFFSVLCFLFYVTNGQFFKFDNHTFNKRNQAHLTDKKGIKMFVANFNQKILLRPHLPETSNCGHFYPTPGLIYQYQGWNIQSDCLVSAVTSAFLPMKRCVALNYTIKTIGQMPRVQVKRDLLFLKLVDSQMTMENIKESHQLVMTQLFCSDERMTNTVALYSIGWITPDQLNQVKDGTLPVKLNWIKVLDSGF